MGQTRSSSSGRRQHHLRQTPLRRGGRIPRRQTAPRRTTVPRPVADLEAPAAPGLTRTERRHMVIAQAVVAQPRHVRRHVPAGRQHRELRAQPAAPGALLPRKVPTIPVHRRIHAAPQARRHRRLDPVTKTRRRRSPFHLGDHHRGPAQSPDRLNHRRTRGRGKLRLSPDHIAERPAGFGVRGGRAQIHSAL